MSRSDHFSAVADGYARYRPGYPPALFGYLADLGSRRRLAWDCATGNGQAAVELAEHFDQVVATDLSASQIAKAIAHPRVEYRAVAADERSLEDSSVDLVTVAQALHWLELEGFYREVQRVLAPGGALACWCYNMLQVEPRINAVVNRYYSQVVGPYWPPERRLLEAGYRTVPFPFDEEDVPDFEMSENWTLEQLVGYLGTWSATTRYRTAEGTDPLDRIRGDLEIAWGDPDAARTIRWPLHVRIGRLDF
ncbi:MAG: class I SAM-dependent methyltransferase [Acidobacteriota bacterium]